MSFPNKLFRKFRKSLHTSITEYLRTNYDVFFKYWLYGEACSQLGEAYTNTFQTYFEEYMSENIGEQLMYAGKNTYYAIVAYEKRTDSLEDLVEFVQCVIDLQLENFLYDYDIPEWCDENFENMEEIQNENAKNTKNETTTEVKTFTPPQIPSRLL